MIRNVKLVFMSKAKGKTLKYKATDPDVESVIAVIALCRDLFAERQVRPVTEELLLAVDHFHKEQFMSC